MDTNAPNTETRVTHVHQLNLKRTIIQVDPKLMRLYMTKDMYFKICANAHYAQMTPDEYVRTVMENHLKEA